MSETLEKGPAGLPPTPEAAAVEPAGPRRKKLPMWDRTKFLLLLAVLFAFVVAADMSSNPILGFTDSLRRQTHGALWIIVLFGIEVLRQLHMLVSEHWSAYHVFWQEKVFGRFNRRILRYNDWNRFRISRALKWIVVLALAAFVYSKTKHDTVFHAVAGAPGALWSALPSVLQIVFIVSIGMLQFAAIFWLLSRGGVDVYFPDDVKTRFSDVWGQDHVLSRVQENVFYLEKPEEIESKGGYVPGGILLWGPPGTGKTLMAEAVAGETGRPYVFVDPGAFINMFFGIGVLKVKSLFRKLRKLSLRYGGVIVFFDEADTLGSRGGSVGGQPTGAAPFETLPGCNGMAYASSGSQQALLSPRAGAIPHPQYVMPGGGGGMSGMDGTLQALLTEMSGLKKPRGFVNRVVRRALGMRPKPPPKYRILVMMATNMPQALDEALLRPGRIDRMYKVGYPSKQGRVRTYEGYLGKVRHVLSPEQIEKLAVMSPRATGATIKDTVNEALVQAIKDGRDEITYQDVLKARTLKEHGLPDDHEYEERERHSVALHEACHAVVMYRLQKNKVIDLATIERRGDVGGFVSPVQIDDQFFEWKSEVEIDVMTFLASLVGERMFFEGDNTQGVGGDMAASTQLVMRAISSHAMGDTLMSRSVTLNGVAGAAAVNDGSEKLVMDGPFGQQVEAKLRELYDRTEKLLAANRREVLAVTHVLETHKTVTGEDIAAVIDGTAGPLVDGRRYAEPDFLGTAEDYHRRAVEAHRHQTREALHLPDMEKVAASRPATPAAD